MNYSKLYNPDIERLPAYVWPMTQKAYKPGQQTTYQLTHDPDPKKAELQGYVMAGPCQIGMYREDGVYCTYQPPIDGIRPGKYLPVLYGEKLKEAKSNYERDKTYAKYGKKFEDAI